MSEAFDHVRVSSLLRIIHDTVNIPGMDAIRDAAAKELAAISGPLREAAAKEAATVKAKVDSMVSEAAAHHRKFVGPVAANLAALKQAEVEAGLAWEKNNTPETTAAKDAAAKAYKDALAVAEASPEVYKAVPSNSAPDLTTAKRV